MAKTKAQKLEILKGLKEKFSEMKSVIFVNFSGLPVKEINNLRNSCKEKNVNYIVAKKTLLKKVLAEKAAIIGGTKVVWQGPITKQDGTIAAPAGHKMTLQEIETTDYLIKGVVGSAK